MGASGIIDRAGSSMTASGCSSRTAHGPSSSPPRPVSGSGSRPNVTVRSRPGTTASAIDPGENPSLRFHSVGSTDLPAMLRGMARGCRSTRRPVGVVGSMAVKWSLGNGNRHRRVSSSSQAPAAVPIWSITASTGRRARSIGAVGAAPSSGTSMAPMMSSVNSDTTGRRMVDPLDPLPWRGRYLLVSTTASLQGDTCAAVRSVGCGPATEVR
jgi:hypothetical protein